MEYVDYSSGRKEVLIFRTFPGVIKRIQDEINEDHLKEAVMQLYGASAAVISQSRREETQHTTHVSASCRGNAIITVWFR